MAKMLICSPELSCSQDVLTIVAMLSVPMVWLRPNNQRKEADAAKQTFTVPDGDHLTLLNVFNSYKQSMLHVFIPMTFLTLPTQMNMIRIGHGRTSSPSVL